MWEYMTVIFDNMDNIVEVLGVLITCITSFFGLIKICDLLKNPVLIKGLEDFETRLKTKRANYAMAYFSLTALFFTFNII